MVDNQVSLSDAGLDISCVDEDGLPVAVAIKLARNGDRRRVVAQIVDYLSSLTTLTVDEVDSAPPGADYLSVSIDRGSLRFLVTWFQRVLNAGRPMVAFIAVTGAPIAVVDACSRTTILPIFHYPGGAVLIDGLSMTLVWLMRHMVPFAFPPRDYRLRSFEIDERSYRRLGVVRFKWLLFKSRVELLNFSARLSHGRTGLHGFERGIIEAETDHAIALLVMVLITIYAAMNAWWALASWLLLVSVVANAYPIMLQRYNRARLLPVLEKLGGRDCR